MSEYKDYAAKCLLLADQTKLSFLRMGLIDMAHMWLQLAEQEQAALEGEGASDRATFETLLESLSKLHTRK